MKKLMIAAAAAVAVSAGVYAKTALDAQVYDFTLTVKTTACKQIKVTKSIAKLELTDYSEVKKQTIDVRKPATTKIVGVIWGCDCITIADPAWRTYGRNNTSIGGYLFWNPGTEDPFNVFSTDFGWAALNRIYKGDTAEGVWRLTNWDADNVVGLIGAGQGKVKGSGLYLAASGAFVGDCRVVLSSRSGNVGGFLLWKSAGAGCAFCGGACAAWQFCRGCDLGASATLLDLDLTAAYGSWKIKYNSSASKKLRKTGYITESYSFKKAKAGDGTVAGMKRVEAAAKRGDFAGGSLLEDFIGDEEDEDEEAVWSEPIDPATVGAVYYSSGSGDGAVEGEPPAMYEGTNPIVLELLGLDDDAS